MAREKVMLCLPPTTVDQTIYDTTMLKGKNYTETFGLLEIIMMNLWNTQGSLAWKNCLTKFIHQIFFLIETFYDYLFYKNFIFIEVTILASIGQNWITLM